MTEHQLVLAALCTLDMYREHYTRYALAYWLSSESWFITDLAVILKLKKKRNRLKAEGIVYHDRILTERMT